MHQDQHCPLTLPVSLSSLGLPINTEPMAHRVPTSIPNPSGTQSHSALQLLLLLLSLLPGTLGHSAVLPNLVFSTCLLWPHQALLYPMDSKGTDCGGLMTSSQGHIVLTQMETQATCPCLQLPYSCPTGALEEHHSWKEQGHRSYCPAALSEQHSSGLGAWGSVQPDAK